jgi:hypothetical protein
MRGPGRSAPAGATSRSASRLFSGSTGAVKHARRGDVHVKCDPVVGVTSHPRHIGRIELPRKQRRPRTQAAATAIITAIRTAA